MKATGQGRSGSRQKSVAKLAAKGLEDEQLPKSKTLEKMRASGLDWRIEDVERVCSDLNLTCEPPSHGSHYKVSSTLLEGILTVPFKRPIKPVYIKKLVSLADAHLNQKRALLEANAKRESTRSNR